MQPSKEIHPSASVDEIGSSVRDGGGEISATGEIHKQDRFHGHGFGGGAIGNIIDVDEIAVSQEREDLLASARKEAGRIREQAKDDLLASARKEAGRIREQAKDDLLASARKEAGRIREQAKDDLLASARTEAERIRQQALDEAQTIRADAEADALRIRKSLEWGLANEL
jgi:vacuolar-type H+-ATPase subunit E/Vma4